ncbi:MAG: rhodanese-like domain-containing protein [Planctomycetota bacterium]
MSELPLEVSCQETKTLVDAADAVLIDCREEDEHQLVHIAGARLTPMSELAARVEDLRPLADQRLIVHCHHGMRSAQVAVWLRQNGFERAQSMAGGIDRWSDEIDPSLPKY